MVYARTVSVLVWVAERNQGNQMRFNMKKRKRRNNNGNGNGACLAEVSHFNRNGNGNGNGNKAIWLEAKSDGQEKFITSINHNKLTICTGPAGTGKTYVSAAMTARLLRDTTDYDHIMVVRPAVEACNERLGFLPGNIDKKMAPYAMPVLYNLSKVVGKRQFIHMKQSGVIQVMPLAFMRGLTLDHCLVILDEAQNTTPDQMKMFLTRIGENCKVIVEGDTSQSDIRGLNGLSDASERLEGMRDVGIVSMGADEVIRSRFVSDLMERYPN
jgi:phosphate starvation-inducible PhoH-like protein